MKIKKYCHKCFAFTLFLLVLALFLLGYFASLVAVKDRDVTEFFNYVNRNFAKQNKAYDLETEQVILSWNQESFSFDLNFFNNNLLVAGDKLSIPHLVLDVSRRSLLLGRFAVNNLTIPKINYSLQQDLKQLSKDPQQKFDIAEQDFVALLDNIVAKFAMINGINIGEAKIYAVSGEMLFKVKDFTYNYDRKFSSNLAQLDFFLTDGADQANFAADCVINKFSDLEKCEIRLTDFNTDLLEALTQKTSKFTGTISSFAVLSKLSANSYQLLAKNNISNLQFTFAEEEYVFPELAIDIASRIFHKNLILENFEIVKKDQQLNLKGKYDLDSKDTILSVTANNINKRELFLLWPKIAAPRTRDLLQRSFQKVFLEELDLLLKFKPGAKRADHVSGKFQFKEADYKFSRNLLPLTEAAGIVTLENKKLEIFLKEAKLAGQAIRGVKANIPKLEKSASELFLSANLEKYSVKNLLRFLLVTRRGEQAVAKISRNFPNSSLSGDLALQVKLKRKYDPKDLQLNFNGYLHGGIKDYMANNSLSKVTLNKKYTEEAFLTELGLDDAIVTMPYVAYRKPKGEYASLSLSAVPSKHDFALYNLYYRTAADKLKGQVVFNRSGLAQVKTDIAKFAEQELNLNLFREDGVLKGQVLASKVILQDSVLTREGKKNNVKSTKTNIQLYAEQAKFEMQNAFSQAKGKIVCNNFCDLIYVEGKFPEQGNYILKIRQKAADDFKLSFESDDLGGLIKSFALTDKIEQGQLRIEASKNSQGQLSGSAFTYDFLFRTNEFLVRLFELKGFLRKEDKVTDVLFENGKIDFTLKGKGLIEVGQSLLYGNSLGLTGSGYVDLRRDDVKIKGQAIPAYKLNNLLGVKDIPVLGKLITGENNEGLISAKYSVRGKPKDLNFEVDTLSAVIPSAIRDLFNFRRFFGGTADKKAAELE